MCPVHRCAQRLLAAHRGAAPPVSRRKRSSSPSRISSSVSARTRAAASSIASGMPSSRCADLGHRRGIVFGHREIGCVRRARSANNSIASSASASDGTRTSLRPAPRSVPGWWPAPSSGHGAERATSRRTRSRRCSQLSSTSSSRRPRREPDQGVHRCTGRPGRAAQRPCHRDRHHLGIGDRRQVDVPGAVGERGCQVGSTCTANRVLPTPPAPVSVTNRFVAEQLRQSRHLLGPADELVSWTGRLWAQAFEHPQPREIVPEVRVTQLDHPLGSR